MGKGRRRTLAVKPSADDGWLVEYRNQLATLEQSGSPHLDRIVLTLSGGGIAVSLALLDSLEPTTAIRAVPSLWIAWLVLAASLLFLLASVVFSQQTLRTAIQQIDDRVFFNEGVCQGGRCAPWVDRFNKLAAVSCGLGILLLLGSAAYNAQKGESGMADRVQDTTGGGSGAGSGASEGQGGAVDVTRGQVLPAAPAGKPSVGNSARDSGGKK